jgi:hypothetical protein
MDEQEIHWLFAKLMEDFCSEVLGILSPFLISSDLQQQIQPSMTSVGQMSENTLVASIG